MGGSDLLGEVLGLEGFVGVHQEKVKVGLLAVAQDQILADLGTQILLHLFTGGNGVGSNVIHALVRNLKGIQQVIAGHFLLQTARGVRRATGIQSGINVHDSSSFEKRRPSGKPLSLLEFRKKAR